MRTTFINFKWGFTGEAQTMVVDSEKVVSREAVSGTVSAGCGKVVDLQGAFLLPKFVDAHCHILPTGQDLSKLNLGSCQSREEVLNRVRDQHAINPEGWLLAVHYNQTKLFGS
jgi:predicted amidohydrolase YtcJ